MRKDFFLLMIVFCIFLPPLLAEEPIVITAVSDPVSADSLPLVMTTINADDIEKLAPQTLVDLFTLVPGTDIQKTGGILQSSSISIRGTGGERLLVLINGERCHSASSGTVDFSSIPLENIERIEIIRGAAGALYGEGSIGGVINIITNQKDALTRGSGKLTLGSHGLLSLDLSGNLPFSEEGLTGISASAHALRTESDFSYDDEGHIRERENADGYNIAGDVFFYGSLLPDDNIRIQLSLSGQTSEKGSPGILEFPTPDARIQDTLFQSGLSAEYSGTIWGHFTAEGNYQYLSRHYTDDSSSLGDIDESNALHVISGNFSYSRMDDFLFLKTKTSAGYNLVFEQLDSSSLTNSTGMDEEAHPKRLSSSVFFAEEMHFFPFSRESVGRLILTPALRYQWGTTENTETDSVFRDNAFLWSVGISLPLQASQRAVFRGNIGTSWRKPTFQDLFWPETAFAIGNPSLKPEKAFYYDISLALAPWSFLSLEITHFREELDDMIQWNPGPGGLWRPENISKAVLTGLELSLNLNGTILPLDIIYSIQGSYGYLMAKDMTSGSTNYDNQLPRRPFEQGSVLLSFSHINGPFLSLQTVYTGYRFTNAQNTDYIPMSLVFHATGGIRLGSGWTVTAGCRNIMDTGYVHLEDYPVPGREFFVSVAWSSQEKRQ